jgi:hypothetical protein
MVVMAADAMGMPVVVVVPAIQMLVVRMAVVVIMAVIVGMSLVVRMVAAMMVVMAVVAPGRFILLLHGNPETSASKLPESAH